MSQSKSKAIIDLLIEIKELPGINVSERILFFIEAKDPEQQLRELNLIKEIFTYNIDFLEYNREQENNFLNAWSSIEVQVIKKALKSCTDYKEKVKFWLEYVDHKPSCITPFNFSNDNDPNEEVCLIPSTQEEEEIFIDCLYEDEKNNCSNVNHSYNDLLNSFNTKIDRSLNPEETHKVILEEVKNFIDDNRSIEPFEIGYQFGLGLISLEDALSREVSFTRLHYNDEGDEVKEEESIEIATFYTGCNPYFLQGISYCKFLSYLKNYAVDEKNRIFDEKKIEKLFLSTAPGNRINMIRILNAIYLLKFYELENGQIPKKNSFMNRFGNFSNVDLSKYDADLSQAYKESSLEANLKIFDRLKRVTEDEIKKINKNLE